MFGLGDYKGPEYCRTQLLFTMYKLRTMQLDALECSKHEAEKAGFIIKNDGKTDSIVMTQEEIAAKIAERSSGLAHILNVNHKHLEASNETARTELNKEVVLNVLQALRVAHELRTFNRPLVPDFDNYGVRSSERQKARVVLQRALVAFPEVLKEDLLTQPYMQDSDNEGASADDA
jgi:hypothetical protein